MSIPTTLVHQHTGKFSDSLDEAVWESTLEGCNEAECGSTEEDGHNVLVIFDRAERAALAALRDEDGGPVFGPRSTHRQYRTIGSPVAAIVTTECSGSVSVSYFDSEANARAHWALVERSATEAAGPQEEDITTTDHRTFHQGGKVFLRIEDDRPYGPLLRAQMELDGFFPNVWFVSDHGNAHLLDLEAK